MIKHRNERFDVIRGVAILLVLGRHENLGEWWHRVGWLGVDIFFVLSGFLVAGSIFAEFQRAGDVQLLRFWVRRAMRIYPAFLTMIGATLAVGFLTGNSIKNLNRIVAEFTWTQNYQLGVWGPTWSLAVEEHFYFLLPLLIWLLLKLRPGARDPFRALPGIVLGIGAASVALRFATEYLLPYRWSTHASPTHLRLDSLFVGVALAYYVQFRRTTMEPLYAHRWTLLAGSLLLFSTSLRWQLQSPFMHTAGFTAIYMGTAGLLVFVLSASTPLRQIFRPLALVGQWSYSIYLWHAAVASYLPTLLKRAHLGGQQWVQSTAYLMLSLAVGYFMYRAIELPALQWRERFAFKLGPLALRTSKEIRSQFDRPRTAPIHSRLAS